MQTAAQIPFVRETGQGPAPAAPQRAEFRFASDAALERALGLARSQSWIGNCTVDRAARTLRVVLSAGTAAAASSAPHILH